MILFNWKTKEEIQEVIQAVSFSIEDVQKIVREKVPVEMDSLGNLKIDKDLTEEEKEKILGLF